MCIPLLVLIQGIARVLLLRLLHVLHTFEDVKVSSDLLIPPTKFVEEH